MAINKEELVQRSRYGLRRAVFSRTGLVALLFLVQVGLLVSVMVWFNVKSPVRRSLRSAASRLVNWSS